MFYVQNNGKNDSRLPVGNNITYWEQKLPSQVSLTFESILLSRTVLSLLWTSANIFWKIMRLIYLLHTLI